MRGNNILSAMATLEEVISPQNDMNTREAKLIILASQTKMEIAGNSYLYGFMRGSQNMSGKRMVPLYNIRQMSDDEWNILAKKNREQRKAIVC